MALGGWRVSFEPTIVYIAKKSAANFAPTVAPPGTKPTPAGTPGVLSVRPKLTDDGPGKAPIAPGASAAASLEFIGRIATKGTFFSMGTMNGTVEYNLVGKVQVPHFTCKVLSQPNPSGGAKTQTLDFTAGTVVEVTRSDWAVQLNSHPDHFDGGGLSLPLLRLPWVFDPANTKLELSARLTVAGTLAADEKVNPPLGIPLAHQGVEEDLDPGNAPVTIYGVRTAMPSGLTRPKVTLGSNPLRIFFDPSVTTFIESDVGTGQSAAVRTDVRTVLAEVGFPTIELVMTGDPTFAAEQTRWQGFVTRTDGFFHVRNITNLKAPAPNNTSTAIFLPNRRDIINGDGNDVPYFDYFVGLENGDPPATELGIGEMLERPTAVNARALTKRLIVPIVLFGGSRSKGIRATLAKVNAADRLHMMANIILHEIGHGFGLRHGARIDDATGYTDKDGPGITNSLLFPTAVVQSNSTTASTAPCRLNFYGPVQRRALRDNYGIP